MTKEEASLKTTREDTSLEMTKGDCTRKGRDQGKSGAVLQPLSHCAEGLASVGNGILLFFRYIHASLNCINRIYMVRSVKPVKLASAVL